MEKMVKRYFELKQQQKEIEQELSELRAGIMGSCSDQALEACDFGAFHVKIVKQERKEYDDQRLYQALPDPDVWRMMSKADPAKITSLLKLKVISEDILKDTFTIKRIESLLVDKK
ncbi:hypothetical protein [Paenibacillus pinistramenti]|uniref:hypothetical protein n=1 Tax=Paenibacillus pinistramenti TaxID=1768003 RepID=UPI00110835A1|nr:hypothetical protein [Paenibacillus pinistramenti]